MAMLATLAGVAGWWHGRNRSAAAQASFLSHARELGRRVARMVLAVIVAIVFVFIFYVRRDAPYLGVDPYQNLASQVFSRMYADLVPAGVAPAAFAPTDAFVAIFDVALGLGVLLALPYILLQLGGFFGPALKPRERRILVRLVVPCFIFFVAGVAFAYVVVLPRAYEALYTFADVLGAEKLLQVNEFVSFTLMFLVLTGIAFQAPLVMYGLARAGIATAQGYLKYWRHAVVAIVVAAGIVTPDPTPVSQILVSGPMVGLYFLGVWLAVPAQRAHQRAQL